MDLLLSDEDKAFREEIRRFVRDRLPPGMKAKSDANLTFYRDDTQVWQRILDDHGYAAPNWPVEHGGTGWSLVQRYIFDEELILGGAPRQHPYGFNLVGPVIFTFGSAEQKEYYLPRIRRGLDWWCQGYSEPNAGSDLAALKSRAVRDGDDYIVNGHKIWTSTADEANIMFALLRTSVEEKRQDGISFFLIPMDLPGITVRPIYTIDGMHGLNEVFFDDVRVPATNRVGEEGKGWTYAKFLLQNERVHIFDLARSKRRLRRLQKIAAVERIDGISFGEDPVFSLKIAQAEADLTVLEYAALRFLSAGHRQDSASGSAVSVLKVKASELAQRITELTVEMLGPLALPYEPENWSDLAALPEDMRHTRGAMQTYLHWRASTIYGGSTEIMKNIAVRGALGI